jgi:alkylation response protein AidB-like acyl-CoA dehydrogenase
MNDLQKTLAAWLERDAGSEQGRVQGLIDSGLSAVHVPSPRTGRGASLGETVDLVSAVTNHCPATGLAFALHTTLSGCLRSALPAAALGRLDEALAGGAWLWGPQPEALFSGGTFVPSLTCAPDGDGFAVTGSAWLATGAAFCTHVVTIAADHLSPASAIRILLEHTAAHNSGIVTTAARSGSAGCHRKDLTTRIATVCDAAAAGPAVFCALRVWRNHCVAAVLLGMARRAYSIAVAALRGDPARNLPGPQFAVGEMRSRLGLLATLLSEQGAHARVVFDAEAVAASCIPRHYAATEAAAIIGAGQRAAARDRHAQAQLIELAQLTSEVSNLPDDSDLACELIGKAAFGLLPGDHEDGHGLGDERRWM